MPESVVLIVEELAGMRGRLLDAAEVLLAVGHELVEHTPGLGDNVTGIGREAQAAADDVSRVAENLVQAVR